MKCAGHTLHPVEYNLSQNGRIEDQKRYGILPTALSHIGLKLSHLLRATLTVYILELDTSKASPIFFASFAVFAVKMPCLTLI